MLPEFPLLWRDDFAFPSLLVMRRLEQVPRFRSSPEFVRARRSHHEKKACPNLKVAASF